MCGVYMHTDTCVHSPCVCVTKRVCVCCLHMLVMYRCKGEIECMCVVCVYSSIICSICSMYYEHTHEHTCVPLLIIISFFHITMIFSVYH